MGVGYYNADHSPAFEKSASGGKVDIGTQYDIWGFERVDVGDANQGGGTPPAGGAPADWYDIGSKINATWGAVTPFIKSSIAYSRAGAAYLKYYASGWAGGSRALIKTVKFARVAAVAGFAAGEIMDGIALYNGKIGWTHAGANLIMGVVGFTKAAPVAVIYFGVDAFYPGGVSGLVHKYGDVHTDFSHIGEPQDNWDR